MARPSFSARSGADPFGPPNARTQKQSRGCSRPPGARPAYYLIWSGSSREGSGTHIRPALGDEPAADLDARTGRRAPRVCRRRVRSASRYGRRRERPARRSQEARRRGRSAARTTLIAAHCAQPLLTKRQHAAVSGPRRCPGSCPRRPRPARRSPPLRSRSGASRRRHRSCSRDRRARAS
jgi:hypothetical protein